MNWKIVTIILAVVIIILGGLLLLNLRGNEDTWLCQNGAWVKHGNPSASMPTEGCGNVVPESNSPVENIPPVQDETPKANIVVEYPKSGDTVSSPFGVWGEARVFENTFNYRLKTKDGKILAEGTILAEAPDMGQYGSFKKTISYKLATQSEGTLEVFDYSAKDGSEIDKVLIPVMISKN